MEWKVIARIHNDYTEKFGVPRQSGLVPDLISRVIFEPEYRDPSALMGIEEYSHQWLIWEFSQAVRKDFSPTVRPPRLGGNERKGVFATRSPFRPNPIGLSCVSLLAVEKTQDEGNVLIVGGADLMNDTPIYDIKPYLPYSDALPEAKSGFTGSLKDKRLTVRIPQNELDRLPKASRKALEGVLSLDPRPRYQDDPERIYGMDYAGFNVRFRVEQDTVYVLTIRRRELL